MLTLTYRYATLEDVSALHTLIEDAYRGKATAGQWDSESHILRGPRTSIEEITTHILDTDSRFVLAEAPEHSGLIACALIQRTSPDAAPSTHPPAYFAQFAIDTSVRAQGLGKRVLAECEARVRDLWNAPALKLSVISLRTELMTWYERRGYVQTGERIPFPFSETTGELRNDFDLRTMQKMF